MPSSEVMVLLCVPLSVTFTKAAGLPSAVMIFPLMVALPSSEILVSAGWFANGCAVRGCVACGYHHKQH